MKKGLEFGTGSVGPILNDPAFCKLDVRDQARLVGWANSCPVVEELTDPNNPNPGRGPEAMLRRYAEVNLWFGFIGRAAKKLNPDLYEQLMAPVARLRGEPVGKFEEGSVPDTHAEEMSPMGTLAGYALPRMFVEQLGTGRGLDREEVQNRLIKGLKVLDETLPVARTPLELLALLAEGLTTRADLTPAQALKHVLSKGWLEEHGAYTMMSFCKGMLARKAPTLRAAYQQMSAKERAQLKIA